MGDCEVGKMRRRENEKNWKMVICETEKLEMVEDKKLQRREDGSWKLEVPQPLTLPSS